MTPEELTLETAAILNCPLSSSRALEDSPLLQLLLAGLRPDDPEQFRRSPA